MENNRSPKRGLEAFLAGKGFYIALSLCAVIIGVTAWAMMKNAKTGYVETPNEPTDAYLSDYARAEYTPQTPVGVAPAPHSSGNGLLAPDSTATEAEAPTGAKPSDETPVAVTAPEPTQQAAPVWNETGGDVFSSQVFCWPLNGEIENPYSADMPVFNRTMSDWRTHEGVDIAAPLGTQVMAAASGRVEDVYTDELYGVTVVIDHMGGLRSVYANLAETPTVYVGDGIIAGEIIGAVGTSALCEAGETTHLHFAMTQDGVSVDPADYLP